MIGISAETSQLDRHLKLSKFLITTVLPDFPHMWVAIRLKHNVLILVRKSNYQLCNILFHLFYIQVQDGSILNGYRRMNPFPVGSYFRDVLTVPATNLSRSNAHVWVSTRQNTKHCFRFSISTRNSTFVLPTFTQ